MADLKDLAWEKRESCRRGTTDRRMSWIVHGKTLSVEFWIQVGHKSAFDPQTYKGEPCWPGGFEVHGRSGDGDGSPGCSVLGGQCWHDGSSLSASEFFETWDQSDEQAIHECARWVCSHEPVEVTSE